MEADLPEIKMQESAVSKAEWLKPGLVGRVKFLRGEETLRHASLKDFRDELA